MWPEDISDSEPEEVPHAEREAASDSRAGPRGSSLLDFAEVGAVIHETQYEEDEEDEEVVVAAPDAAERRTSKPPPPPPPAVARRNSRLQRRRSSRERSSSPGLEHEVDDEEEVHL